MTEREGIERAASMTVARLRMDNNSIECAHMVRRIAAFDWLPEDEAAEALSHWRFLKSL